MYAAETVKALKKKKKKPSGGDKLVHMRDEVHGNLRRFSSRYHFHRVQNVTHEFWPFTTFSRVVELVVFSDIPRKTENRVWFLYKI